MNTTYSAPVSKETLHKILYGLMMINIREYRILNPPKAEMMNFEVKGNLIH